MDIFIKDRKNLQKKMNQKIKSTLRKLGLTDGETRVYLALLGKTETTVGPVIDKAQISSSKIYVILEKLIQKGLVNYIMKDKTRHFQASPPIALIEYVEQKEEELQETKKDVDEVIKLIEIKQIGKQPKEQAKIYKGYKGLKTAWLEAIKSIPNKGNYYFMAMEFNKNTVIDRFFNDVARKLRIRKIKLHGSVHKSQKRMYKEKENKFHYKMNYTSLSWPTDVTVAGDYVLINDLTEEPVVYSIRSKLLAESYISFIKKVKAGKV